MIGLEKENGARSSQIYNRIFTTVEFICSISVREQFMVIQNYIVSKPVAPIIVTITAFLW